MHAKASNPGSTDAAGPAAILVTATPLVLAADSALAGIVLAAAVLAAAWGASLGPAAVSARPGALARLTAGLIVAAGLVTLVQLLARSVLFDAYVTVTATLGLTLAVAVAPGTTASPLRRATVPRDAIVTALLIAGFAVVREALGHGTLLGRPLGWPGSGLPLIAAPAGVFILLGLVLAASNAFAQRRQPGS